MSILTKIIIALAIVKLVMWIIEKVFKIKCHDIVFKDEDNNKLNTKK